MTKQKFGFTLVELLAVIAILGIVAVIVIPGTLKTINTSREKTFLNSVNNLMRTVKLTQKVYMFDEGLKDIEFNYNEGIESSNIPGLKLDYSGENPKNGTIRITKDGEIGLVIHNDEYCAIKNYDSNEIILDKSKYKINGNLNYVFH
ncbi:MAG: prepilin-type N-terminal cleavage/methylation domain-containing protein [Bacilli bacterium]|nr:prepilin-type N-terminal cleavage/methylation domain-containing protein [Bacilli bacterium]MDD4282958.1 prepilin-type N-terminal cleavage/methylation domain-containing protein [Bacilli bacterium]MDD4718431.1 prepilin-type N-terminal cleavage/methylation domain-containing protein [Bacilli bacterium]